MASGRAREGLKPSDSSSGECLSTLALISFLTTVTRACQQDMDSVVVLSGGPFEARRTNSSQTRERLLFIRSQIQAAALANSYKHDVT
jgi:hypothetical protein